MFHEPKTGLRLLIRKKVANELFLFGSLMSKVAKLWRVNSCVARKRRLKPALYQSESLEDRTLPSALFSQFIDPNPSSGNGFGNTVVPLSTGNIVITSPYDNFGGTNAGAVYLFDGATGLLISTLRGSSANDRVGEGGVTELTNGNFVVNSPYWDNGSVVNAGAVTFGDGITGVTGFVSGSNSLIGSSDNDQVGGYNYVTALSNGNYVVASPDWDNGSRINAGAVTFGDGTTGVTGFVSASNSLVGDSHDDQVGYYGFITALPNGNYVVSSPNWDGFNITNAGAVTFGEGTTGVTGSISVNNSLVGSSDNDQVGFVTLLTNGNYVVSSPFWDTGSVVDAGAVTFANGAVGVTGVISASNSLVGSSDNDQVGGYNYVTALTNGNYVVASPDWDNTTGVYDVESNSVGTVNVGAVTFGDGTTGVTGSISFINSLIGTMDNDHVGGNGYVTALNNGNYVVSSPHWDNSFVVEDIRDWVVDAGAVTFGNGVTGITGFVSPGNSLVGSSDDDQVGGYGFVTALTNGNYVVTSSAWDNGSVQNAGAVTFGNGTTGISGSVSDINSLVGSFEDDQVGGYYYVTVLTNGNYVVPSSNWDNGSIIDAGAITFGNGRTGISGTVSESNSLVGATSGDSLGYYGSVTALANGNYVISSPSWDNVLLPDVGAVTFGNGTTGVTGYIAIDNSLVGSSAYDEVGRITGVSALANGNYVVSSPFWDNVLIPDAGAVTFGNGISGVSGEISEYNSLIGSKKFHRVGTPGASALTNGNYVSLSHQWYSEILEDGTLTELGALTFGNGDSGVSGVVSTANSAVGVGSPYIINDKTNRFSFLIDNGKVRVLSQVADSNPPYMDELNDLFINENAPEQYIDLPGITTENSGPNSLRITATSSNSSLIPHPFVNYTSADDTGTLAFTPVADHSGMATITVTVEDGGFDGDIATVADNKTFQRTFNVTVYTPVDIDLRIVRAPTDLQSTGEVIELPDNLESVSEWGSFWQEIWIRKINPINQGSISAILDLNYNTEYISATSIEYGPGFTQNQTGMIDDSDGVIDDLHAESVQTELGTSSYLLFARIKYESTSVDHVDIDFSKQSVGPYDLGFSISTPRLDSINLNPVERTSIWANPFDLNDDDVISYRDLVLFSSVYREVPSDSNTTYAWIADLNQNNRVEFRDLILFASNYGKKKAQRKTINYPGNFPEAWNKQIIAEVPNNASQSIKPSTQDTLDTIPDSTNVDIVFQQSPGEKSKNDQVKVDVFDLDYNSLGQPATIYFNRDASTCRWFVDAPILDDGNFENLSYLTLISLPGNEAKDLVDPWTVIRYELGDLTGYEHIDHSVMKATQETEVQKMTDWNVETDRFFSSLNESTELLSF
ncbi:MAG: hypothetical protein CME32_01210 [Gimesia sp.]|nr:hypothetical protein [Gimesia sp.]